MFQDQPRTAPGIWDPVSLSLWDLALLLPHDLFQQKAASTSAITFLYNLAHRHLVFSSSNVTGYAAAFGGRTE